MKVLTSDLTSRAFDLANMSNTDFISDKEVEQYLNDSWVELFQSIVNKGDLQFIKEASVNDGTWKLPEDLYQIAYVKEPLSGKLYERKATSEGDLSPFRYEIKNDTITVHGGKAVMGYWVKPLHLTFPYRQVSLDGLKPVAACNGLLATTSGSVYEIKGSELYKTVKSIETNLTEDTELYLGQDWYVLIGEEEGQVLTAFLTYDTPNETISYFEGRPDYVVMEGGNVYCYKDGTLYKPLASEETVTTSSLKLYDGTVVTYGYNDIDGMTIEYDGIGSYKDIVVYWRGKDVYLYRPYNKTIEKGNAPRGWVIYGLLDDYVVSNQGLSSIYSDTWLNFPNELYFQTLAANLAMRFKMKSGEDYSSLSMLYENMYKTWTDTLSQDAGYDRISNTMTLW